MRGAGINAGGGGAGKIQKLRIEEGDYSVLKSNEENMHKN